MKCDICFCTNTYIKEHEHIYHIKGKEIKFVSNRRFCSECNNLVYDEKLDNEAGCKAIEIYNDNFGIPKEKIIELRKKYNLSQELFSKIIGCAKKTLISYEKGTALPNDNYIIIINSLIAKPNKIKTLIEANKIQFSNKEYEKIQNKITIFLGNNSKQLFENSEFIPTEYNGYTKLNKEKLISYNIIFDHEYEYHNIKRVAKIKEQIFTKEELEIINKVKNFFDDYKSKDIVEFSHKEKAFTETEFYKKISYDYAFDIESVN